MKIQHRIANAFITVLLIALAFVTGCAAVQDPLPVQAALPSWKDGPAKKAIL